MEITLMYVIAGTIGWVVGKLLKINLPSRKQITGVLLLTIILPSAILLIYGLLLVVFGEYVFTRYTYKPVIFLYITPILLSYMFPGPLNRKVG
jgi:hypothetical protein